MKPSTAGPDLTDWVTAAFRGLHPLRWAVGLVGLALTGLIVPLADPLFKGSAPDLAGWWADPIGHARDLGTAITDRSTTGILIRLGPLLAGLIAAWCLVGGWIARHELIARYRGQPGQFDPPTPIRGPTGLAVAKARQFALCPVAVLSLLGVVLLPALVAGVINDWFGGVGAILVAILLPVVLVGNLIALLLAVGLVAWPLMPATLAAEQTDVFDGLSRAYNYAFERPFRFMFLMALTVGIAGLPLAIVLGPLADAVRGQPVVIGLAAGLSASIFWSLITLVYLHLRWVVDDTDAGELADPPEPASESPRAEPVPAAAEPAPAAAAPEAPAPPYGGWRFNLAVLPFAYGAWFLTVWLLRRTGGDDARWLDWGLADGFVPPADGLRTVAAAIALVWGIAWFLMPIVVALRPRFKGAASPTEPTAT